MNRFAIVIVLLVLTAGPVAQAADYSDGIKHAVAQLGSERSSEGIPIVEGVTTGYPGRRGTFDFLWPFFLARAKAADVELMLHDESPAVRIMGARRVVEPWMRPLPLSSLDLLAKDEAKVRVGPIFPGKVFKTMTVGAVVEEMKRDPDFFLKPDYGERVRLVGIRELRPVSSVQPIEQPLPVFPAQLAEARISGSVTVRFTVRENGSTSIVHESARPAPQVNEMLQAAAWDAVSRWKFSRPARGDENKSEPVVLECQFDFRIEE